MQVERIIAEHHQILLSFKASEGREGAEPVRDADDAAGVSDMANDPLLIKIAVSISVLYRVSYRIFCLGVKTTNAGPSMTFLQIKVEYLH